MTDKDGLTSIRDLLGEVGQRIGLSSAVETGRVWSLWPDIVGPAVAAHAEPSSLKAGVLRVRADSPSWATEIGYLGDDIKAAVNAAVGVQLVTEVKVWTGAAPRRRARRERPAGTAPSGPSGEAPQDPETALARAHRAWERRRDGGA